MTLDNTGTEHTIHFTMENQFIADYSSFILKTPSVYMLQAIGETEAVIMPRSAIEWGYPTWRKGDRLSRLKRAALKQ
ncbi:MAG: hypothetical protein R2830_18740 [Saprospiraceae bacterium]